MQELLAAYLTTQFYDWELRGRGWALWDHYVALEPPFRPFAGHLPPPQEQVKDDGFQHSLFTASLAGLLKLGRLMFGHHGKSQVDLQPEDEEPTRVYPESELVTLRLSLPATLKDPRRVASQFLLSLPAGCGPVSFELIGLSGRVGIQMACRKTDAPALTAQLQTFFPGLAVAQERDALELLLGKSESRVHVLEFALASEFMLPLASAGGIAGEPLTPLVAALSQVTTNELAALQVLFQPARAAWASSALAAISDGRGGPFFAGAPQTLPLAKEKLGRPLFAVVIRAVVRNKNEKRSQTVLRSISGALSQFGRTGSNELLPLSQEDAAHSYDFYDRLSRRSGMLLSVDELSALVHLPGQELESPALKRQLTRTHPTPSPSDDASLELGLNTHAGTTTPVRLSQAQRLRHIHIIGATGTGKSTLLLSMILQGINAGEGLAVLDPHGDLIDELLSRMPESRVNDVALLDPSDREYTIGVNVLEAHSELERELLASDLVSIFRRLATSWGDQMNSVLANAVLAMLDSDSPATLLELRRFLIEPDFRAQFLKGVADPEVRYYWDSEFRLLRGKPQAPILTRLNAFLRSKPIHAMVTQTERTLDFRKLMDERGVLLAKLSHGRIGEENSYLLGALLLSKFHQIAQARQEKRVEERTPFYLYVDEFQNFLTPSTSAILSGARKFGLGLVLAHQSLSQLGGQESGVLGAAVANPATRICFRVGETDARKLRDGFAHFDATDLLNLGVGQAICRIDQASSDFSLETSLVPEIDRQTASSHRARVIAASRDQYASRRDVALPGAQPFAAESPPPTEVQERAAATPAPAPPASGRGGREHKRLQQLFRRQAQSLGYKASTEHTLPAGAGSVDLWLQRDEDIVACEISTSPTSLDQELKNVRKCSGAGALAVSLVATTSKRLSSLKKQLEGELEETEAAKVLFHLPEEFLCWLQERALSQMDSETRSRGYRVKLSREAVSETDQSARKKSLAQILGKLLRKKE